MNDLANMVGPTFAVILVISAVGVGILILVAGIQMIEKLFNASQPDDPTDPEPTAEDFPIAESFVPLPRNPDRYLEFEDEYLAAGGNDNPDAETF